MPITVTMPALSPTMEEGTLATWLKAEGDTVEAGDVIAEIETDKATMEVEAVDEGTLGKILVEAGTANVKVNTPIAVLLEEGENDNDIPDNLNHRDSETPNSEPEKSETVNSDTLETQNNGVSELRSFGASGSRIFASPLARRIAKDKGLDLSKVKGSGPKGRIIKADVTGNVAQQAPSNTAQTQTQQQTQAITSPSTDTSLFDKLGMTYTAEPHTNMRKVIAKRLLESKQTIPHFYLTIEAKIDGLLAARKKINDAANGEYKLSVNDFVIKACASALNAYPAANRAWTDEAMIQFEHADVSVAVATPAGLITPIIKNAETKSMRQISEEMKDLASRARENKLAPEEYQGGTFSISNLGMFGIDEFSAIINPPQSCILAVGGGVKKPCVGANGEVSVGTFMKVTLSCDHRVVDGAVGAEFLQVLRRNLEDPLNMLV